ncbi:MAG: hypothetical protein IKU46_10975 [Peptococcaceae bacterium]|nr:hypothetical protein [Peptococcaceae bacterium]
MEVYALIGASGTGKSHNANSVMEQYNIEVMIDDGLLIKDGKKMAGSSAKAEETTVGAVKRAIFHDPLHAAEVRERIGQLQPKKILILGTSEKMIDKITAALNLPPVKNKIFIQDIVTPEQIELAQSMRREGKHVIPLPSIEVKKDLPNYWIDSIWSFMTKKNKDKSKGKEKDKEQENDKSRMSSEDKCIVRPRFSQLGRLTISENAIEQLVRYNLTRQEEFDGNAKIHVDMNDFGVSIYCEMKIKFGIPMQPAIERFQVNTIRDLDEMTNLSVGRIDVRIIGITA